ncbi:mitochondrial lipoate-protein ligase A [Andalucia godoyi]|uniref:lipoate--protein ligase n=1 Tax=Andalucia godoyi TaxID=505711 RepID=A0A8K0F2S8_ANDGO|nr:mitochondrial lipoate-protein ligase A [Andalucia godoyi]|eukprot:ANDGO_05598.mRNA.1 mitochondrial lipoate-protein ligase A
MFRAGLSRVVAAAAAASPQLRIFRSTVHDPWFNLATEEWIFNHLEPSSHTLFLWRNDKTVVIGRNQNPWKECHLQKMEDDRVLLARRKSGGGAVFQDLGNTCFTFMSPMESYSKDNNGRILIESLKAFGISAEASGRNDLVISDTKRKFSGSAFKITRDRAFHHGTLLINVDMTGMGKYLNPSKAKLLSKGVTSVQARVVNLTELNPAISHEGLCSRIEGEFCRFYGVDTKLVAREDLQYETLSQIEELKSCYESMKDWNWRFGQTPDFTHHMENRFNWATMDVQIDSENGVISKIAVYSDSLFPLLVDLLRENLRNARYDHHGMRDAFNKIRAQLHALSVPVEERTVDLPVQHISEETTKDPRVLFSRTVLEETSMISAIDRDGMLSQLDEFENWFIASM